MLPARQGEQKLKYGLSRIFEQESKAAVPSAAYILIDGTQVLMPLGIAWTHGDFTQVGLKTQLIERLPDDEAEKAALGSHLFTEVSHAARGLFPITVLRMLLCPFATLCRTGVTL